MSPNDRPRQGESKTLAQYAAEAAQKEGREGMTIAGKPADKCPYCGCVTFRDGVNRTPHEIVRYVTCRNPRCLDAQGRRRRFVSTQPPERLVREVYEDSAGGNAGLTIHRESA